MTRTVSWVHVRPAFMQEFPSGRLGPARTFFTCTGDGHPDYKRIADLTKLSKADLSKIAQVAKSSVRFDAHIPEPFATRLREIANIANLVAEFFAGDEQKVGLWFEIANPMLGNVSPRDMIRIGRYKRLLNF